MRLVTVICATLLLLSACAEQEAANPENIGGESCTSIDYPGGVFVYPCVGAKLANALARFSDEHPGYQIRAVIPDHTLDDGVAASFPIGYIVVAGRSG